METLCIAGLGIIGSIWAEHAKADGYEVRTWNRTPKPELDGFTEDLAGAVRESAILHICVADPSAVQSVLEQVIDELGPEKTVIQSSTISPVASEMFERLVKTAGARYVEAPFTGSKPAAEARQLVYFIGGSDADVESVLPWLKQISRCQFRFDRCPQAAAIKLSMNLQIAAVSQALTEGWHLAQSHGLTHEQFYTVLRENVAHSGLAELKEPKLATRDDSPQFSVKHMRKDLGLALGSAGDLNMRLTQATKIIYDQGMDEGLGDLDFIALRKLVEAKADS